MQCNIDARGRLVRRNGGLVCLAAGIATAVAAGLTPYHRSLGIAAGVLIVGGLFQLFEARKGWCAVRALGFKTPV